MYLVLYASFCFWRVPLAENPAKAEAVLLRQDHRARTRIGRTVRIERDQLARRSGEAAKRGDSLAGAWGGGCVCVFLSGGGGGSRFAVQGQGTDMEPFAPEEEVGEVGGSVCCLLCFGRLLVAISFLEMCELFWGLGVCNIPFWGEERQAAANLWVLSCV